MIKRNLYWGFRELQTYVTVPALNHQLRDTKSVPPGATPTHMHALPNVVHSEAGVNILLVVCIKLCCGELIMVKSVLLIATPTSLCDKGE